MTRPTIVRADTIDLQNHSAPSAKDHSKHPSIDTASLAPHQAETLREIAHETAEDQARSPRVSWSNIDDGAAQDLHQYARDLTAGVSSSIGDQDEQSNSEAMAAQEDALAIAQNGGISSSDEGDLDGDDDLDDDLMDKISSSPSIEDEDIDFEFVYALHTFVATVEGQANATKGDTMVLLDDSNSYWWLVRVVKDSSIGYLPAEHIETPTERLARLNKHRNVDLSATMLGDQADKTKQPGFKAIRRRRKNVSFAPPTYVDYSDFDYSTDEEDIDELFGPHPAAQLKESQQKEKSESSAHDDQSDETAKVEPLKPRIKDHKRISPTIETVEEEEESEDSDGLDKPEGPSRSRNGTVRNTDSFFKDDSVETKKITLTPNLLRDDTATRQSSDSTTKELKGRSSLDKMDKELMSDKEKKKQTREKDKKEKDKKPSAIRSFFSRKDKKKAGDPEDDESLGKRSMDTATDSQGRDSEDPSIEEQASPERQAASRNTAKLQKQQRVEPPTRKGSVGQSQQPTMELSSYLAESRTNDVSNVPPASMRIVDPETQETQEIPSNQRPADVLHGRSASASTQRDEKSILSKVLPRSASAAADSRPQKTVKAKARMELEDLVSEDEEDEEALQEEQKPAPESEVNGRKEEKALRPQLPGAFPDSFQSATTVSSDTTVRPSDAQQRLSESPVHVSPTNATNPPALEVDTSSQGGRSSEGTPSPELVHGKHTSKDSSSMGSSKSATWDDEKLRAFFDEGDNVRDLLVVVYDKSDVIPAGKEHPVVGGLFREQNAKLAEITTQLDNMLGDWLARKQRMRGTV